MQHLWLFVEHTANAVATKLTHHRKAVAFGKALDRVTNVTQVGAGFDLLNAFPHGIVGQGRQAFGGDRCLTDMEHAAGVAMPAVLDDGDVDVHRVPFFQGLVVGDAMANLVVDRGADGFGIGLVATGCVVQRRRNGFLDIHDVVVTELVEFVGGDTRLHIGRDEVENFGGQAARHAHRSDVVGIFDGDGHGPGLSHWVKAHAFQAIENNRYHVFGGPRVNTNFGSLGVFVFCIQT